MIGENNNGKTALIDAIRIAFSCVLYKKDIFFSKTDFHVNAAGERAAFAQIDVYLKDVPQNLIEIWDPIQPDCGEFHVVFTLEKTAAGTDKVILKNLRVSIFNSTRFFVAVVHHQYSHRRKNDGSTEMIKRNDGISEDDICQNQCATLVRA